MTFADAMGEARRLELDRITADPAVLGGKPCVRGLRFSVAQIVDLVAEGMTAEEIVADFPPLETEDVRQALRFAAAVAGNVRQAA